MAKIKEIPATKPDKKALRHEVENLVTTALSGILNGTTIPKALHKKIKKAGKLLAEGISEIKRAPVKTAKLSKKSVPKKSTPKRATKKAASK